MTTIRTMGRIIRMEGFLPRGCRVCRDWSDSVITAVGLAARPEACPTCGRHVPIRQVVALENIAWEDI